MPDQPNRPDGTPRDHDEVARRRQARRRQVDRAIAWRMHERIAAAQKFTRRPGRAFNRLEAKFARLLDSWSIDYRWQFPLGSYVYDFLLPGKVLVEVHGTYYHADPRVYPPDRLTPAQRRTVVHDVDKRHFAARRGYRLRVVWEREVNKGELAREDFSPPPGARAPGRSSAARQTS